MNKKKAIVISVAYASIMLILIFCLILFNNNQQNSAKIKCYIASQAIESGTKIDTSLIATSTKQTEVHKSYQDLIVSYNKNVTLITRTDTIVSGKYVAAFDIPAGTVLTSAMFVTKQENELLKDYTNPQYVTLPVQAKTMPANGFVAKQKMTIVGLVSKDNERIISILSSDATVYNTIQSESGVTEYVVMIVEEEEYASLLMYGNDAGTTLYYCEGQMNDISEISSDIIDKTYSGTGLTTNFKDLEMTLDVVEAVGNTLTYHEAYDAPIFDDIKDKDKIATNLTTISLNDVNKAVKLSYKGPCNEIFVEHFVLDKKDTQGDYSGTYSYVATNKARKIRYNSDTQIHDFEEYFNEEGYYRLTFFDSKTKDTILGYAVFVIEENSVNTTPSSQNLYIKIGTDYDNLTSYMIDYSAQKDYYANISDLEKLGKSFYFKDINGELSYSQSFSILGQNIQTNALIDNLGYVGDLKVVNIVCNNQPLLFDNIKNDYMYGATLSQMKTISDYLGFGLDDSKSIDIDKFIDSFNNLLSTEDFIATTADDKKVIIASYKTKTLTIFLNSLSGIELKSFENYLIDQNVLSKKTDPDDNNKQVYRTSIELFDEIKELSLENFNKINFISVFKEELKFQNERYINLYNDIQASFDDFIKVIDEDEFFSSEEKENYKKTVNEVKKLFISSNFIIGSNYKEAQERYTYEQAQQIIGYCEGVSGLELLLMRYIYFGIKPSKEETKEIFDEYYEEIEDDTGIYKLKEDAILPEIILVLENNTTISLTLNMIKK